jgi:SAM-dependent methyltransferase
MLRSYLNKRHRYVGVDFSTRPLIRAARYSPADYFRGDLNHLPFANSAFDLVVSLQSLQYLDRSEQVLRQIARVLRPGGHFLLSVPNSSAIKYRLTKIPKIQLQKFNRSNLSELLLSANFHIKEITTRGFWFPFPKLSVHLGGKYPAYIGLSWTTASVRPD